jgi:hypothetical protein
MMMWFSRGMIFPGRSAASFLLSRRGSGRRSARSARDGAAAIRKGVDAGGDEPLGDPRLRQDEGELAHLAERDAGDEGRPEREPGNEGGHAGGEGLDRQDAQGRQQQHQRVQHEIVDIQQHADGDEKEAREHVLEGKDLPQGLMAVFGVRDDQSRQEGAEGQGEAGGMGEPGHGQADGQRRDQKKLPAPGLGDAEEDAGDEPPREKGDEQNDADDLAAENGQGAPFGLLRSRQQRDHEHHRDHGDILEDKDAQGRVPLGRFHFGAVLEDLHDDGRAAERNEKAGENRLAGTEARQPRNGKGAKDGQQDLQGSAQKDGLPDPKEAPEGELQADGEHEQNDARLRQRFDRRDLVDQGQAVRSGQEARQEEADDDGQTDPVAEVDHHHGQQNDDQDVVEDECFHFPSSARLPETVVPAKAGSPLNTGFRLVSCMTFDRFGCRSNNSIGSVDVFQGNRLITAQTEVGIGRPDLEILDVTALTDKIGQIIGNDRRRVFFHEHIGGMPRFRQRIAGSEMMPDVICVLGLPRQLPEVMVVVAGDKDQFVKELIALRLDQFHKPLKNHCRLTVVGQCQFKNIAIENEGWLLPAPIGFNQTAQTIRQPNHDRAWTGGIDIPILQAGH